MNLEKEFKVLKVARSPKHCAIAPNGLRLGEARIFVILQPGTVVDFSFKLRIKCFGEWIDRGPTTMMQ
jgi:hypothetical protein